MSKFCSSMTISCHPPHCYLFDELISIVGLTDSNGTLVSTYQYDPYGNLTSLYDLPTS